MSRHSKKRLRELAEIQRKIRAKRDRKKLCRTCGEKAVKSKRTGKLTKSCQYHLDIDAKRKAAEQESQKTPAKRIRLFAGLTGTGMARDVDRNRTKRVDGEIVRPLSRLDIKDGEKHIIISDPAIQRRIRSDLGL